MGFPFKKLKVYQKAAEWSYRVDTIAEALPSTQGDLLDILRKHSFRVPLEIVRGAGRPPRRQALHHFRNARRSAETCESVLLGLCQAGSGSKEIEAAALESGELRVTLDEIAAAIRSGLSAPDVFRNA